MKKWLVFILIIVLPLLVKAQSVQLDYPDEVSVNQEFNINLQLINFTEDIYDVKIDISEGDLKLAQIYNNNTWKSTFYYVNNAIQVYNGFGKGVFKLRVFKEFQGISKIEVRIKNSKESTKIFSGYTLHVSGELNLPQETQQPSGPINLAGEEETNTQEQETQLETVQETTQQTQETLTQEIQQTAAQQETITGEVINLGKGIKTQKSKTEYIKEYSLIGFTLFCIILLILLVGYKKNRENV